MMGRVRQILAGFATLTFIMVSAAGVRAQVDVEVFVKTGDQAPGRPAGQVFRTFGTPVINASGEIAFSAALNILGSDERGIWRGDLAGNLRQIARQGDQAPGTPAGVTFTFFNDPVINSAGQVAFVAGLTGSGPGGPAVFGIFATDDSGNVNLIMLGGSRAPETPPGVVFSGISTNVPVMNSAGDVAFLATVAGPGVDFGNDTGIWSTDGNGILNLVAREGDQAPDTLAGTVFDVVTQPVINAAGTVAFRGRLRGPGITGANSTGIWATDGMSTASLIVRAGDAAPVTPAGVVFAQVLGIADINAAGEIAFDGILRGPDVTPANISGIFVADIVGNLRLVVRRGDPAPGTPPGVAFGGFETPVINAAGNIAVRGTLVGPGISLENGSGVWGPDEPGSLRLVARAGDPAPGTPAGTVFRSAGTPVVNATGGVAFLGLLTGPDVTPDNFTGFWGPDEEGNLGLIVRKGDLVELSPGNSLPLIATGFHRNSGNEDGRISGLSDSGQTVSRAILPNFQEAILLTNRPVVSNSAPVADAGPDRTVACSDSDGTLVALDGSGSSDPDGDPLVYAWTGPFPENGGTATGIDPIVTLQLGPSTIGLVVNDGQLESGPDSVTIAVRDATPPGIVASFAPIGSGDEAEDDDEGDLRVNFAVTDSCDPAPVVAAVLIVQGCGAPVAIADDQVIEFEVEDDECEIEREEGILEIEGPGLAMRVTAADAAGNIAIAEVVPTGLVGDNDDDAEAAVADTDG